VAAEDLAAATGAVRTALEEHGVVLLPTETFYGLGACPHSHSAVARVRLLKGRPETLALPVLCGGWQQVERLVKVAERHRARLENAWPGPLTAVMPCAAPLPAALADTLAVRIPGHPLLCTLLDQVGPLTGTSANRHGDQPSTTVSGALESLLDGPDLVLDGGATAGGSATTVVDLTRDPPVILRRGVGGW
jgi:L-threonylcarbamoyladenylate synthase